MENNDMEKLDLDQLEAVSGGIISGNTEYDRSIHCQYLTDYQYIEENINEYSSETAPSYRPDNWHQ